MRNLKNTLVLDGMGYYEKHLEIVGTQFGVKLTPAERRVLACFMDLPEKVVRHGRFSTNAKKHVISSLGLSESALSQHLKSLVKKEFIKKEEDGWMEVHRLIACSDTEQTYIFTIKKRDNGQEDA